MPALHDSLSINICDMVETEVYRNIQSQVEFNIRRDISQTFTFFIIADIDPNNMKDRVREMVYREIYEDYT